MISMMYPEVDQVFSNARSPLGRRQLVPVRAKDYVIGA